MNSKTSEHPISRVVETGDLKALHHELLKLEYESWDVYQIACRYAGLTENELWILLETEAADGILCQADIARNCGIPIQTVNSALSKMVKKGWIELVPLPENRKTKRVVLTEEGIRRFSPMLQKIHEAEQKALGSLEPEQLRMMFQSMQQYVSELEKQFSSSFSDPSDA